MRCISAAIVLMLNGCALGSHEPVVAPILEPTVEDADPLSRALTQSLGSLLAADLIESDVVGGALGIEWSLANEDPLAGGVYSGRARELPLTNVHYERWIIAPHIARLTMQLAQTHCYDARALVFNFAPEHIATPYALADGDLADISTRAYFDASDKKVFLAYRRERANERSCVAEIALLQPARSDVR